MMLCPTRLDEPKPPHNHWKLEQVREHRDFWLRRLDKMHPPAQ